MQEDLEVTGISRSGRVRKKSSKLMDFESPDDIETRYRRQTPVKSYANFRPEEHEYQVPAQEPQRQDDAAGTASGSESDYYENTAENPESMESDSSQSDEGGPARQTPANSLYMMEKSAKKKLVVKDGRIVGRVKAQRKDKGKTRITAYMMWAKEARHEVIRKHPDMDFSAISKRLGEMWSNVNYNERYVWKRKAKRFALQKEQSNQTTNKIISNLHITVKRLFKTLEIETGSNLTLISKWGFDGASGHSNYKQRMDGDDSSIFMCSFVPLKLMKDDTGDVVWENPKASSTFYCRPIYFKFAKENDLNIKEEMASIDSEIAGLIPTFTEDACLVKHQLHMTMIDESRPTSHAGPGRPPRQTPRPQPPLSTPPQQQAVVAVSSAGSLSTSAGGFRVSGCGAVEVAAHLRLLGESLAIIGERLKEHEGQIAVSGSVSVLLDTLLCSLAPLLSVCRAVPAIAPPAELLQDTLHNIAYIMPGL